VERTDCAKVRKRNRRKRKPIISKSGKTDQNGLALKWPYAKTEGMSAEKEEVKKRSNFLGHAMKGLKTMGGKGEKAEEEKKERLEIIGTGDRHLLFKRGKGFSLEVKTERSALRGGAGAEMAE